MKYKQISHDNSFLWGHKEGSWLNIIFELDPEGEKKQREKMEGLLEKELRELSETIKTQPQQYASMDLQKMG